jgi:hypothetical protein
MQSIPQRTGPARRPAWPAPLAGLAGAVEPTPAGPPVPVAEALAADQAALEIRVKRISAALAPAGIDSRAVPAEEAAAGEPLTSAVLAAAR